MVTEVAERPAVFGLMDTVSGNMVGSFASEQAALLAVAATVREYGATSDAVLSLSLLRWDVPPEQGFVADGEVLARRALDAAAVEQARTADHRAVRRGAQGGALFSLNAARIAGRE